MPRTLDEIIQEQGSFAQTPVPPVATYSTPWWGPAMGGLQTPSQAELIRQATPQLPPMALSPLNAQNMALAMGSTPMGYPVAPPPPPSPMTAIMAARAAQYVNPQANMMGAGLAGTQGFLNPANAGQALAQQALGGQSALGSGMAGVGNVMGFLPGGQAMGLGLSLGGQWLGDQITNNPLTRWAHRQMYGSAATDLSNMAGLQHGTAGMMNLAGGAAGLGGTGMSAPAALQLGQRFRRMGTQWAEQNPALAEQMGGGDADVGAQRYTQDLTKLTQMAGEHGLLDAATNINQVGDTVSKLFKVLGAMGKITGDPDFRNNLREIANMRQLGFTIDQAVTATRDLQMYARGAGMTREQMMVGGGAMGQGVFAGAGMVGGVGMVYGAQATMQARQLAGAYTPMQEALLGGREGIAQRWTAQQAHFATGPMNMMMGAAMTAGPGGISLDSGRMAQMLRGGMSLSGLAGQSQGNLMRIAQQMAQQQGRPVQDVMVELMQRQPELQSMMAQQLGPEGMRMLQMQTISALARPGAQGGMGMGLHTAAQLVAGGDPRQAQMLVGMMSSPEFYQREKDRLGRHLAELRSEAREERARGREERQEIRDQYTWWGKTKGAVGGAASWVASPFTAIGEGVSDIYARANAKRAEETARELAEQEDAARGIRRVHFGRTLGMNARMAEEEAGRLGREEGLDLNAPGVGRFERLRRMQERGFRSRILRGAMAGASAEQIELAQEARGEEGLFAGGFGERQMFGLHRAGVSALAFFTGDRVNTRTVGPVGETRRTIDQTLEMAQAVEDTQNATLTNLASAMKRDEKLLTEAGAKTGAIFAMKKTMLEYAERVGRGEEGKVLNKDAIRKHLRATLKAQNVPEHQINKILSDANMDHWKKMTVGMAKEFGTKEAKAAVSETTDVAERFFEGTTEQMQEKFDTFQEQYEAQLAEAGITGGGFFSDSLTTEEKQAMEAMQGSETAAEREAMVLMGVMEGGEGEEEGITKDMREQAEKKLNELLLKDTATYEKVQKRMKTLRETGGEAAIRTVGRMAKIEQRYAGTLANLGKSLEAGYKEGKGYYGVFGAMKKAMGEAVAMGGRIEEGALVMPTETGVGTSQDAAIKVAEGQLQNLDEMKKQFAGFGRSAKTLQIAAEAQIAAAKMLGGKKVAEVVEKFQEKIEED